MTPPPRARRVTAHLLPATPNGRISTPLPATPIDFGDDPATRLRTAANLPPTTPLTPVDVRTELATLHHHGHPIHMHIDRLYYTTPTTDTTPHPTLTLHQALTQPPHPTPNQLLHHPPQPANALRRFAAYGLVTDTTGRLLLSKIAPGYPGEGTWHLPGGAVDHNETVRAALTREISEESNQNAHPGDLIAITHHRHRPHKPSPYTDIYSVWVFLHAHVPHPSPPQVTETNGSTIDAAWFTPHDLPHLRLSTTARRGLTSLLHPHP